VIAMMAEARTNWSVVCTHNVFGQDSDLVYGFCSRKLTPVFFMPLFLLTDMLQLLIWLYIYIGIFS